MGCAVFATLFLCVVGSVVVWCNEIFAPYSQMDLPKAWLKYVKGSIQGRMTKSDFSEYPSYLSGFKRIVGFSRRDRILMSHVMQAKQ